MIKLNLGSGEEKLEGYINVDLYSEFSDIKCDVRKLSYNDNSVDEIRAYHIIEHFNFKEAYDIIKEWYRVLKPGGLILIETPDLLGSCKKFVESDENERINLYGHFFSTAWVGDWMIHKFLYTETQLRGLLNQTGFKNIIRCEPNSKAFFESNIKEIFLNMKAIK